MKFVRHFFPCRSHFYSFENVHQLADLCDTRYNSLANVPFPHRPVCIVVWIVAASNKTGSCGDVLRWEWHLCHIMPGNIFWKNIYFTGNIFLKNIYFTGNIFLKNIFFTGNIFFKKYVLHRKHFWKNIYFTGNIFLKNIFFTGNIFCNKLNYIYTSQGIYFIMEGNRTVFFLADVLSVR